MRSLMFLKSKRPLTAMVDRVDADLEFIGHVGIDELDDHARAADLDIVTGFCLSAKISSLIRSRFSYQHYDISVSPSRPRVSINMKTKRSSKKARINRRFATPKSTCHVPTDMTTKPNNETKDAIAPKIRTPAS